MNVIVALQRHQLAAWGRLLADADELLRNAQYAFHNVGYGSTNSKKFASRAGSLARRIIRKYPASPEAAAARSILESLGERLPKPAAQFQHVHSRTNEHRSHVPAGDRSAVLRNLSSASGWLMPGWPLRLMQAIPVVVGAIFVFQGLSVFWYWQPNVESAFLIAAGGILIYSPKLNVFTDFVNYAKTRTFVKEDWDANANDMPTIKDIVELVRPFCMATAASASLLFLHSFSYAVSSLCFPLCSMSLEREKRSIRLKAGCLIVMMPIPRSSKLRNDEKPASAWSGPNSLI